MKASHRYRYNTPGISHTERARRIAQSYGYKTTIHDNPQLIALLQRAGIDIKSEQFVDIGKRPDFADAEVLTL